jgi:hypothetical protein
MPKARIQVSRWVYLVAGPILSLVAFVVAYYINPLNFGDNAPLAAVPACLLSIVVLLIGQNLAAFRELEQVSKTSALTHEAVKNYLHVIKIGSPETAIQYMLGRLPIVAEVRGTRLNMPDEIERTDDRLYSSQSYTDLDPHVLRWTRQHLRWKDIGDARVVDRLRAIAARAAESERSARQYQYKLIEHSEPQITFSHLTYLDGTAEVLFNWDFRSFGQDPVVLLSRDRDIVDMFAIQFEHLWRCAMFDCESTATRSTSKK